MNLSLTGITSVDPIILVVLNLLYQTYFLYSYNGCFVDRSLWKRSTCLCFSQVHPKISCAKTFNIFSEKQANSKTVWKTISFLKYFKLQFYAQTTSYKEFQEKLVAESNLQFPSFRPVICTTIMNRSPPIEWHAYLNLCLSLQNLTIGSNYHITSLES